MKTTEQINRPNFVKGQKLTLNRNHWVAGMTKGSIVECVAVRKDRHFGSGFSVQVIFPDGKRKLDANWFKEYKFKKTK